MKRILLKILRYGFFALVCLATLIALVVAEENFRSQREWESYKREMEARGVKFDLVSLIPPPVPDAQNFATTPLFKKFFDLLNKDQRTEFEQYQKELSQRINLFAQATDKKSPLLGDWRVGKHVNLTEWGEYLGQPDILQALKKFDPAMDEISVASRRPYSRFPIQFEKGFSLKLPHLQTLNQLTRLFTLRALAELSDGQTDRAMSDVKTILQLANSVKDEPILISQLVRIAILHHGLQVVWEGLAAHQWSESQLAALQSVFQNTDILTQGYRSLQGERVIGTDLFQQMMTDRRGLEAVVTSSFAGTQPPSYFLGMPYSLMPECIFYQNVLTINHHEDQHVFPSINLDEKRVFPRTIEAGERQIEDLKKSGSILHPHPYSIFMLILTPALSNCVMKFAEGQTLIDEASVACALERYWLAHGAFPENLDALVPQFFSKLPHDVITGEPLKYRRTDDGSYVLYSVGWDETDDGGKVMTKHEAIDDLKKDDWVWSLKPL
jgi:hypothetical protein